MPTVHLTQDEAAADVVDVGSLTRVRATRPEIDRAATAAEG